MLSVSLIPTLIIKCRPPHPILNNNPIPLHYFPLHPFLPSLSPIAHFIPPHFPNSNLKPPLLPPKKTPHHNSPSLNPPYVQLWRIVFWSPAIHGLEVCEGNAKVERFFRGWESVFIEEG